MERERMERKQRETGGYPPEELLPIVAELAASYTGNDHTSITWERAGQLMEAVLYCIREYEEAEGDSMLCHRIPARQAYRLGFEKVLRKAETLRLLYNRTAAGFSDWGLKCLKDTFLKGIPLFLQYYDAKYAPQETILTLDYPVLKGLENLSRVDKVLEYVRCIAMEQQFLNSFSEAYVRAALREYHSRYELLIENICSILLQKLLMDRKQQESLRAELPAYFLPELDNVVRRCQILEENSGFSIE